jgi:hypothetical protein
VLLILGPYLPCTKESQWHYLLSYQEGRGGWDVVYTEENINAYKVLVDKPEDKRRLGRLGAGR